MKPRTRVAVSNYLEVFVLIGVAIGGAGLVFGAASTYSASVQGPSISVTGATIRQGSYVALESLTVYDTGQASVDSFVLSTQPALASASYCYSLFNPISQTPLPSTCPSMTTDPGSVKVNSPIAPGGAVLVELRVMGAAFALGATCRVTVTASSGAQQSLDVQVVPA